MLVKSLAIPHGIGVTLSSQYAMQVNMLALAAFPLNTATSKFYLFFEA